MRQTHRRKGVAPIVEFIDAVGSRAYHANGNQTWTFYDARRLVVETMQESPLPPGEGQGEGWLVTRTIYDNNGRAIYTTDSFVAGGNLSPLLPGEGQGEGVQGTYTVYDGLGRATETQRLDGLYVEMYQDSTGQWDTRLESGYTPTVISSSGTTYNDAGQVAETTDEYGTQTQYTYDADGRTIETRTQSLDQNGNLVWLVSRTAYDAAGQTVAETDSYVDGASTANITGTLNTYDADGRTTCTKHVQGLDIEISSTGILPVASIASSGTVVWQTESVYDSQGRLSYGIGQHAPGQDGPRTDYYYDTYGRQIAVLGPVKNAAGYASPVRALTEYVYDSSGQQTSVTASIALLNTTANFSTHPDLTIAILDNANAQTTAYQYDALGNRVALTDPDGNTTTWAYNDLGQCTEDTNALDATEHYAYDSSGRLASKTDRDGRVTTYSYDAYGRETAEDWLDSQNNVIYTLTYSYDAEGDLLSASDPTATYTYSYDAFGRATSITIAVAGLTPTVVLAQQFDDFGNRTQLAASIGGTDDFTNDYVYNALGLLAEVEQHGQTAGNAVAEKRVDFTYNSDSLLDTLARYADLGGTELVATSTYGYDLLGQLTSLVHRKGTTTLAGYTWTYDAAGNLTQEVSMVDGTVEYTNDLTGQLVGANYDGAQTDESYSYDANGNRTNTGYATGANNQLLSDGTYRYLYDADGNRIAKFVDADGSGTVTAGDTDITTYSWDYRDRLTQVSHYASYAAYSGSQPDQVVQYAYDYQNHLVKKVLDSNGDGTADSSSIYVYDGNQIALQFDHSGTGSATAGDLSHRYLWGQAVDQVLADEQVTNLQAPGNVVWPLTDHLGTARDLATYDAQNDVTTIANHRVYNAYGALQSQTNAAVDCIFGYTGRQFDSDTGLQNNLNRWYDPAVGRWLGEDSIGFVAGDTNLYRYVSNQPTLLVDPSGQFEGMIGLMCATNIQTIISNFDIQAGQAVANVVGYDMPTGITDVVTSSDYGWLPEGAYTWIDWAKDKVKGAIQYGEQFIVNNLGTIGEVAAGTAAVAVGAYVGWKCVPTTLKGIIANAANELWSLITETVSKVAAKVAGTVGWTAPAIYTDAHGFLTNGIYRLDTPAMAKHTIGSLASGDSQFLFRVNEKQLVLDAAAYAEHAGLWAGSKAKVVFNEPIGVCAYTGELTNTINLYRTATGLVHGLPGNPS